MRSLAFTHYLEGRISRSHLSLNERLGTVLPKVSVMRSSMMANRTTARPDSKPRPISSRWILARTSLPKPPAPTIEAMMTMDKDIMMVWLIPAMMEGKAPGICTLNSTCAGVQPKVIPASTCSLLTCRMPRLVSLTTGGIAKITVASTPGTRPRPNNMAAGMR